MDIDFAFTIRIGKNPPSPPESTTKTYVLPSCKPRDVRLSCPLAAIWVGEIIRIDAPVVARIAIVDPLALKAETAPGPAGVNNVNVATRQVPSGISEYRVSPDLANIASKFILPFWLTQRPMGPTFGR